MRTLLFIGAFLLATPSAPAADFRKCESYLLAPKGLRVATRELFYASSNEATRDKRRAQIESFVRSAPLNSEDLIKYLFALRGDSEELLNKDISSWVEPATMTYLMRPGNESLAAKHLRIVIDVFWIDLLHGSADQRDGERLARGFAATDAEMELIGRLVKFDRKAVESEWQAQSGYINELIKLEAVRDTFRGAEAYLKAYAKQTPQEIQEDDQFYAQGENVDKIVEIRDRINYLRELVKEIDFTPPTHDTESFLAFHVLDRDSLTMNATYRQDEDEWRSADQKFFEPSAMLVYLYRLERHLGLTSPAMREVDSAVRKFKALLPKYPRQI